MATPEAASWAMAFEALSLGGSRKTTNPAKMVLVAHSRRMLIGADLAEGNAERTVPVLAEPREDIARADARSLV